MSEDQLFNWWLENRFDRFCQYMHNWRSDWVAVGHTIPYEDHSKEQVRINRTISYLDIDDQHKQGGGFIRQYLLIKYGMEFVEHIATAYWELEEEADKQDADYWKRPRKIEEAV